MLHSNVEMLISKMQEENMYKTPKKVGKDMCYNESGESKCLLRKCAICKIMK